MLEFDWRSSVVHIRELFYDFCERHIVFIGVQLVLLTVGAALLLREDTKQRTAAARQRLADAPSAKPKMAFQVSKDLKLDPPKDDPISPEELAQHDGSDPSKAIWVAIKGQVFDVSAKRDMYGPGCGYNIFAGKDGSRGLGRSSLKPEDAVADYSVLEEKDMKVLDDWVKYFTKRYNVVGVVTPPAQLR